MKRGRISQTALKVALSLVSLSVKDDWARRLPPGLAELSERLLLASGSPGYGPALMRASKQRWMIRLYELQDRMMPGQWEGFGHRKIYMQRQVEAAIDAGARQVLVLGAGFDTLCLRLAPLRRAVSFFEIDHPATSAAKANGVAEVGQPENLVQIAADLAERTLSRVLREDGRWDPAVRAVLVAEGLFMYLSDDEVRGLLQDAAACTSPGSRIAFSHKYPDDRRLLPLLTRMVGEPIRSSVHSRDLPDYLAGTGWAVISGVDDDPAHGIERYAVAERQ